ncbi:MAG: peptidylprolyl isomerase [Bacteroidota bacterium]
MNSTINKIIIPYIIIILLLSSCSNRREDVVLQMDEFRLSKESFIKSYSVAPSILMQGNNPRLTYLNAIKNDYLISQYLISQGYGKDSSLSKTLRLFRQELIVEKMFKEDVDDKIVISDKEIRDEVLKGEQQVKVKYIYSEDYGEALQIKNELTSGKSFEEIQESKLLKLGLSTNAGETGFLNYGEVNNEINDVIFSLPAKDISDIIKTEAGYFILKVVDVRRSILSESDIQDLYPTYKKILYNKKMYAESREYIKKFLDPKGIVVDGKVFKKFVNTLYPVYKQNKSSDNIKFEKNQEFFKVENHELSEEFLGEKLVVFNDGTFTVGNILYHLSYYPVSFPTTSIKDFAESLKRKIGLRLRDIFLEKEGIKRGYASDSLIKEEIDLWKNQIITYRFLQHLSDSLSIDTAKVEKISNEKFKEEVSFNKVEHKFLNSYKDYIIYQELLKIVDKEEPNHKIFVNKEMLNKINVPKKKNNFGVDLFSYKMGLPYSRLAFAVPNRIWAAENVWNSIIK